MVKCVKWKLGGGENVRYVTIMLDLSSYYPRMKSVRINSRKFLIKVRICRLTFVYYARGVQYQSLGNFVRSSYVKYAHDIIAFESICCDLQRNTKEL